MDTARELFPTTPRTPCVSPACNNGVPVRIWAVRHDVPVSLVPRTVGLILTRRKMGTVWSVNTSFRFVVVLGVCTLHVFRFTLQVYKSIDCQSLTIIRDCLINWPWYPLMMELGEYYYLNNFIVQFLIGLDGSLRNDNQLEFVLKYWK
jgi:hypothetical protein